MAVIKKIKKYRYRKTFDSRVTWLEAHADRPMPTKVNDFVIRKAMYERKFSKSFYDRKLVVSELGLQRNKAIIDVIAVGKLFHGYEIKSAVDSLQRLKVQIPVYNKVLDKITVVTVAKHLKKLDDMIPPWWGVIEYRDGKFYRLRKSVTNTQVDLRSLCKLLWKREAFEVAWKKLGLKGFSRKRKSVLQTTLIQSLSHSELRAVIKEAFLKRKDWKHLK